VVTNLKHSPLRAPGHDGQDSGLMADSIPATRRTLFRRDGGQFEVTAGTLSAMPGMSSLP